MLTHHAFKCLCHHGKTNPCSISVPKVGICPLIRANNSTGFGIS
jgi:hypothetical protein